MQGGLPFIATTQEISDAEIMRRCQSLRDALRVCVDLSGLCPKEIAFALDIDQAHFSRMIHPADDKRHFPPDLFMKLMEVCGNEVPLRFLALSCGYGLHRLKSELERENDELKAALVEQERKLETITEFLKTVKGA
jgi:hypothetical protein